MKRDARNLGIVGEHIQPAPGLAVPEGEAYVALKARIVDLTTPQEVRARLMAAGAPHIHGKPKDVALFADLLRVLLIGAGEPVLAAHFNAEAWRLDPKNGGRAPTRKTRSRRV